MKIIIKATNIFDSKIVDFLVNESYNLFCTLKGNPNISQSHNEKLKEALENIY